MARQLSFPAGLVERLVCRPGGPSPGRWILDTGHAAMADGADHQDFQGLRLALTSCWCQPRLSPPIGRVSHSAKDVSDRTTGLHQFAVT